MWKILAFLILAVSLSPPVAAANRAAPADPSCGPLGVILGAAAKKYGEHAIAEGVLDESGHVLVILSGPDRKTFTAISTFAAPDGQIVACVLFSGTKWRVIPRYKVEETI